MLSTDCDRWTTCKFHGRLDFMKLNSKMGHQSINAYIFYTMNIVHTYYTIIEYHPYRPHMHVSWWKNCSKCMLWSAMSELPHQQMQIFDRGDHFHLVQSGTIHTYIHYLQLRWTGNAPYYIVHISVSTILVTGKKISRAVRSAWKHQRWSTWQRSQRLWGHLQ